MAKSDVLTPATQKDPRAARRQARADRTRAQALSPVRVIALLLSLPLVASSVAFSVYMRTSPFDTPDAVRHLVALSGCDMAQIVGVAPAEKGSPGYHPRHDQDGDGVSCDSTARRGVVSTAPIPDGDRRAVGNAKFIRP